MPDRTELRPRTIFPQLERDTILTLSQHTDALLNLYTLFNGMTNKEKFSQPLTPAEQVFIYAPISASMAEHKIKGLQNAFPQYTSESPEDLIIQKAPSTANGEYLHDLLNIAQLPLITQEIIEILADRQAVRGVKTEFDEDEEKHKLGGCTKKIAFGKSCVLLRGKTYEQRIAEIDVLLKSLLPKDFDRNIHGVLVPIRSNDIMHYGINQETGIKEPLFKPELEFRESKEGLAMLLKGTLGIESPYKKGQEIHLEISSADAIYELLTNIGLIEERHAHVVYRVISDEEVDALVFGLNDPIHPIKSRAIRQQFLTIYKKYASRDGKESCFFWNPQTGTPLEKLTNLPGGMKIDNPFWIELFGISINGVTKDEEKFDDETAKVRSMAIGQPEGYNRLIRILIRSLLEHDFDNDATFQVKGAKSFQTEIEYMQRLGINVRGNVFDCSDMEYEEMLLEDYRFLFRPEMLQLLLRSAS